MEEQGESPRTDELPVSDNSANSPEPMHSTADYANYAPPEKPSRMPSQMQRWLVWILILVIVFAGLFIAYDKVIKKKPANRNVTTSNSSKTSQANNPSGVKKEITAATKNYASQNFALSFDYPEDWSINDNTGQVLELISPPLAMTDPSGNSFTGEIYLTFTPKGKQFLPLMGTAARDSLKIAYTKPTSAQRANTYVSFGRKSDSDNNNLGAVYITGNSGYKAGQTIPSSDLLAIDPLISFNFFKCVDASCTSTPSPIKSSSWDDPKLSTPLLNIFKSLVIN